MGATGRIRLMGTLATVADSMASGNVDAAAVLIVIKGFTIEAVGAVGTVRSIKGFVVIIVVVIFTGQQAVEVVHHHHDAEQQGSFTLTLRGVKLGYLTARILLKPTVNFLRRGHSGLIVQRHLESSLKHFCTSYGFLCCCGSTAGTAALVNQRSGKPP